MRSKNKNTIYFDDDFEVTYEDDMIFKYDTDHIDTTDKIDFETQKLHSSKKNYRNRGLTDTVKMFPSPDEYTDEYEEDDTGAYDNFTARRQNSSGIRKSHRRYRPTQLAAPIQKGGNAVLHIARTLIRNLTLFLMLAILILMGYTFLRGSTPYGDIQNAVASNTYTMTLTTYFSVAAIVMFYEIISMLWAMTCVRVRDKFGTYREDVGRGMSSFIFLYLCSLAAFYINNWIPESIEILKGFKGALDVFGSMHNTLFGLCLAGIISCLFRKYSITL